MTSSQALKDNKGRRSSSATCPSVQKLPPSSTHSAPSTRASAFVNALPVFIAGTPEWAKKFEDAGLPIVGDDIKSQVGATITHRVLAKLFEDRGVIVDRTYQLNVGGNMDFMNMLERERLESKKISKTQSVTSQLSHDSAPATSTSAHRTTSRGSTTASGPSFASKVVHSATCR